MLQVPFGTILSGKRNARTSGTPRIRSKKLAGSLFFFIDRDVYTDGMELCDALYLDHQNKYRKAPEHRRPFAQCRGKFLGVPRARFLRSGRPKTARPGILDQIVAHNRTRCSFGDAKNAQSSTHMSLLDLHTTLREGSRPPPRFQIDPSLAKWFSGAWGVSTTSSFDHANTQPPPPIPAVREHGTAIAIEGNQVLPFLLRPGSEKSFATDPSEMSYPAFVGYFHTHPYAVDPQGRTLTGVAFSTEDLAFVLNNDTLGLMLFAQSGPYLFLAARSRNTMNAVPLAKIQDQWNYHFDSYRLEKIASSVSVFRTVRLLCIAYGIVLYVGKGPRNVMTLYHEG